MLQSDVKSQKSIQSLCSNFLSVNYSDTKLRYFFFIIGYGGRQDGITFYYFKSGSVLISTKIACL